MKTILRFLKPHIGLCIAATLLTAADMVGMMLIPTFAADMLNGGASGATLEELGLTAIKMSVAALIAVVGAILGGWVCARLSAKVGADIRKALYEKSLDLSVYDFQSFGTASMTTRTASDVANIQFAVVGIFQMMLPVPVVFVAAVALTFRQDLWSGLILLGVLAIIVIVALLVLKGASPLFRKLQKLLDRMSKVLIENLTGVRVVRAFNKEESETERLNDAFTEYKVTSVKANKMFAGLDGLVNLVINLFVVLVYWIAGGRISAGAFGVGDITAIIEYAIMAMFSVYMAQFVILSFPRAAECSRRIGEVLGYKPQITDKTETPLELNVGEDVMSFENVTFRYADSEVNALENLDFTCRRGAVTAIIGGTGSGKSTIASLMLRFNDVTSGRITLGGADIKDMPQTQLRDNVSYVQQKAWLFSGTIAENLRYGNANATDEELMHALDVAQAGDFVRALPDGLNSRVAQGGTNFSGGQKQRLSIARAIVKDPQLYIFDDSFSALDFKTDAALRKALLKEKNDKAMVIIAQRISSIRNADEIIVLDGGKPVGKGRHEELLATCPVYAEIYESQTKEVEQR